MSNLRHGEAANYKGVVTPEYRAWTSMRQRCLTTTHKWYPYYGGRGITICKRWDEYENFLADMGRKPGPEYALERVKNAEGYSKSNCVWTTQVRQIRNRRNTVMVVFRGQRMAMVDALELAGYPATTLNVERVRDRLARGWAVADAVTLPVQEKTFRYAPTA